jgi:hypothetical protein
MVRRGQALLALHQSTNYSTLAGLYSPPAKLGSTQYGASSLPPLPSVALSEVLVLNLDGKPAKVISSCPMESAVSFFADCLCVSTKPDM